MRIPRPTRLWLRGILLHGQQAFRITTGSRPLMRGPFNYKRATGTSRSRQRFIWIKHQLHYPCRGELVGSKLVVVRHRGNWVALVEF